MSIESLNLSFSNKCPAQCVFCPPERGTNDPNFMKPDLVIRLMMEVTHENFPWKVKTIQIGENGEALMSPYFITNLRIIRGYLPDAQINLTSNLFCLKKEQAKSILEYASSLQLNIDGHDAETYEAQKRIPYETVMEKFRMLMLLRKKLKPEFSIGVNVLPLSVYNDRVIKRFNQKPLQAPEHIPVSSYEQVKTSLQQEEWITEDVFIRESPSFFWAERKMKINFDLSEYQCPQLPRIEKEAFISPSGWWYPCCFDSNQDQAYGNVNDDSLIDIHDSDNRLDFIKRLKEGRFEEIGFPCDRAPFCKAVK